jgi:hypothetical protein
MLALGCREFIEHAEETFIAFNGRKSLVKRRAVAFGYPVEQ